MFNGNYTQSQLPPELFNASDGQQVTYNGQTYTVHNHGNGTRDVSPLSSQQEALNAAIAANQAQIAANQPAIATLTAQGTNLADQYSKLLADVVAGGSAAMNTATSGENAFLGARGLLSDKGIGNNQLSQAQNTVATTNETNQQNVETQGALTQEQIASAIAALQAGNLPQAENFAGGITSTEAGVTEQNIASNEALQAAKLQYGEPFNASSGVVYNPSTLKFQTATGGGKVDSPTSMAFKMYMASKRQPARNISQFVN